MYQLSKHIAIKIPDHQALASSDSARSRSRSTTAILLLIAVGIALVFFGPEILSWGLSVLGSLVKGLGSRDRTARSGDISTSSMVQVQSVGSHFSAAVYINGTESFRPRGVTPLESTSIAVWGDVIDGGSSYLQNLDFDTMADGDTVPTSILPFDVVQAVSDGQGGVYVLGNDNDTMIVSNWVGGVDSWSERFSGVSGNSLAVTSEGNLEIIGRIGTSTQLFRLLMSDEGAVLDRHQLEDADPFFGSQIIVDRAGTQTILGISGTDLSNSQTWDMALLRFATNRSFQSGRIFGLPGVLDQGRVVLQSADQIVVLGRAVGAQTDIIATTLDLTNTQIVEQRRFSTPGEDDVFTGVVSRSGDVVLGGAVRNSTGHWRMMLMSLDSSLNIQWQYHYPISVSGQTQVVGIVEHETGGYTVIGRHTDLFGHESQLVMTADAGGRSCLGVEESMLSSHPVTMSEIELNSGDIVSHAAPVSSSSLSLSAEMKSPSLSTLCNSTSQPIDPDEPTGAGGGGSDEGTPILTYVIYGGAGLGSVGVIILFVYCACRNRSGAESESSPPDDIEMGTYPSIQSGSDGLKSPNTVDITIEDDTAAHPGAAYRVDDDHVPRQVDDVVIDEVGGSRLTLPVQFQIGRPVLSWDDV